MSAEIYDITLDVRRPVTQADVDELLAWKEMWLQLLQEDFCPDCVGMAHNRMQKLRAQLTSPPGEARGESPTTEQTNGI